MKEFCRSLFDKFKRAFDLLDFVGRLLLDAESSFPPEEVFLIHIVLSRALDI